MPALSANGEPVILVGHSQGSRTKEARDMGSERSQITPWCSFFTMKKTLALAAGSVLALSVGAGIASASVSAADLQQMISSQLGAQAGSPPDSVVCPGDLATDIGASITCAVSKGGETRGVTLSVVSVENGNVQFNMQLAQQ